MIGRKAQVTGDVLLVVVMLTLISIGFIVGMHAFQEINADIQSDPDLSNLAKATSDNSVNQFPVWGDNALFFLIALFWVLLLVSSFLIDTHPIFFIVSAFLLVFVFVVTMVLANTYQELTDEPDLASVRVLFPKINWIMEHLLIVAIVIGFTTSLALFARSTT